MASRGRNSPHGENVEMPYKDKSPVLHKDEVIERRRLILESLQTAPRDVEELVKLIREYNASYDPEKGARSIPAWSFQALRDFFEAIGPEKTENFFNETDGLLKTLRSLVLSSFAEKPRIKWLKAGECDLIQLHQLQIAQILANAFLCTFPDRARGQPSINFNTLFEGGSRRDRDGTHVEKLKCILHYFSRIREKQPTGYVTFHRLHTPYRDYPRWDKSRKKLSHLRVCSDGKIEDETGHLQMDFANKVIGGGVLAWGCVQEEIRFVVCPELIAARLFTEPLADNEAVYIVGAERFCNYTGYAGDFKFAGDYVDDTPVGEDGCRSTHILVVDALNFQNPAEQYRVRNILRELAKMYTGLKPIPGEPVLPLATGNWGCGAFQGDPELKSLLQLLAASETSREVVYFTFGDRGFRERLESCYNRLIELNLSVGQLYRVLEQYGRDRHGQSVFEFVKLVAPSIVKEDELFRKMIAATKEPSTTSQKAPSTSLKPSIFKPTEPSLLKRPLITPEIPAGAFYTRKPETKKDSQDILPATPPEVKKELEMLYRVFGDPREIKIKGSSPFEQKKRKVGPLRSSVEREEEQRTLAEVLKHVSSNKVVKNRVNRVKKPRRPMEYFVLAKSSPQKSTVTAMEEGEIGTCVEEGEMISSFQRNVSCDVINEVSPDSAMDSGKVSDLGESEDKSGSEGAGRVVDEDSGSLFSEPQFEKSPYFKS